MKVFPIDSDISCGCTPPQSQRHKRPRSDIIREEGLNGIELVHATLLEDTDCEADATNGQTAAPPGARAGPGGAQGAIGRKQRRAVALDTSSDESFQPEPRAAGSRKRRKAAAKGPSQPAAAAQQQDGDSGQPRRGSRRQAARKAGAAADARAGTATDFFMPLAQRKQKKAADKAAAERAEAEEAAQAAFEQDAQEQAEAEEARRQAAKAAAATFQQELKQSAADTAKVNAGRTPHAFFARRAAQADTGAARVKLVTELTEPPLPPIHITQASEIAVNHSFPETTTFRLEVAPAAECAVADSAAADVSFSLCSRPSAAAVPTAAAPSAGAQPASRSLLQELAQQLADAERPPDGGGNAELEDYQTAEQHLQRLRERLAQVSAARDGMAQDTSPAAAAEPNVTPLPPPSTANALWTEQFQPRQPSQVCGNADAVEELRSLLAAWQETAASAADAVQSSRPAKRSHARALLSDSDWSPGEGDLDSDDDARASSVDRGNAVLLTGPVGSGKTAAAYAVAMAAGYRVIEVNPSVNRAGVQVQRLVGEATQSQRVALPALVAADAAAIGDGSADDGAAAAAGEPQAKPAKAPPAGSFFRPQKAAAHAGKQPGGASSHLSKQNGSMSGGNGDRRPVLPQASAADARAAPGDGQAQGQGGSGQPPPPLTLLLFEEVDNLQDEDRGFISTLQELLAYSKCPIVMTSNHSSPGGMLSGMRARRISFARPAASQVLEQLVVVHEADGAPYTPLQHLAQLVEACGGDLRQSIHMAQLLRGCAYLGPFVAGAAPDDDGASPVAEDLDRQIRVLLQADLQPAEQLRMVISVAEADTMPHRLGGACRSRSSTEGLHSTDARGLLGSWTVAQCRYGDACAAWVEAADDALNDSTRAHVSHLLDRRYERLAALRSIAAVQRVLSSTGGGGRTRGRGHRNYFEDSLSLAASAAAELTKTCPKFSA